MAKYMKSQSHGSYVREEDEDGYGRDILWVTNNGVFTRWQKGGGSRWRRYKSHKEACAVAAKLAAKVLEAQSWAPIEAWLQEPRKAHEDTLARAGNSTDL